MQNACFVNTDSESVWDARSDRRFVFGEERNADARCLSAFKYNVGLMLFCVNEKLTMVSE